MISTGHCDSKSSDTNCNPVCVPVDDGSGRCVSVCHEQSPAPVPDDTPKSTKADVMQNLLAEALGTGLLVFVVVGSGIMAEATSDDVGIQLLINAFATTCALYGLISIFGPVSGAHFNPVVSLVDYLFDDMRLDHLIRYSTAQIGGGIVGTIMANVQFEVPTQISDKERFGYGLWISEVIATASLILIIHGCIRTGENASLPQAVSCWVGGGYFFTSSSIFANPAVTIARIFSDTFAGIDPKSMGAFIGFQILGAFLGYGLVLYFYPKHPQPLKKEDPLYRRVCLMDMKDFYQKEAYG